MTAHPHIREAAVVSVPDPKYGEVVGAWIAREPHTAHITKAVVRRIVAEGMNPQVRARSSGVLWSSVRPRVRARVVGGTRSPSSISDFLNDTDLSRFPALELVGVGVVYRRRRSAGGYPEYGERENTEARSAGMV